MLRTNVTQLISMFLKGVADTLECSDRIVHEFENNESKE